MAYKINEFCIACGACEPECPSAAISFDGIQYVIDPDKCTECGTCMDACFNEAIEPPKKS
ncbi:4Fe-4S binding protein [Sporolactobacillus sp. CPB3-1]|uniref:4Fe-4S binding protein n=1 Tax=Sporolactobacillus mangiferae TaxID=2940498 RepID=A0ABT0MCE6_9BACL|nr:4Fe-4S binding protein [Sporolactobacillus mangiferae]MCL1632532.1 4Fe-4S binding protein [Sporolactobacillus mangiferae]